MATQALSHSCVDDLCRVSSKGGRPMVCRFDKRHLWIKAGAEGSSQLESSHCNVDVRKYSLKATEPASCCTPSCLNTFIGVIRMHVECAFFGQLLLVRLLVSVENVSVTLAYMCQHIEQELLRQLIQGPHRE